MKYEKGSEWRKWDLHIHTKGTMKNDQFESHDFDSFCVTMFQKALKGNLATIGITDYFNIENYKKVNQFVNDIDSNINFNDEEKRKIKKLFILPNVELRMLPVTTQENLINIHCLFNPDEGFLSSLENDFFASLEDSGGNKMNKQGIISSARNKGKNLSVEDAYKKGIDAFHIELGKLRNLFESSTLLKENTIIAVSNSSSDGASGLQEHYRLFENEPGSTNEIRKNIYKLSNAIFSGNPKDRDFFLGKKVGHSQELLINECGSLKPCIHGSDAHEEEKLFNPAQGRHCWIKADPTFEGLKQIIYEPEHRVYIGEKPPVLDTIENNATKYIHSLKINKNNHHKATDDIWFNNIEINFNKELVAIIGNKGSGKSGIADILSLLGNTYIAQNHFSFLKRDKFSKNNLSGKFKAELIWESGGTSGEKNLDTQVDRSKPESVRYIPQSYFEQLTNEIEISKFQEILEKIIFGYISEEEKFGKTNFKDLEKYKTENVEYDIRAKIGKIQAINDEIIDLEKKKHPTFLKNIEGYIEEKEREIESQKILLQGLPMIPNPEKDTAQKFVEVNKNSDIDKWKQDLQVLESKLTDIERKKRHLILKRESLGKIKEKSTRAEKYFREFIEENKSECESYGLDISNILKVEVNYSPIDLIIDETNNELSGIAPYLQSIEDIMENDIQGNNQSILWEIEKLKENINAQIKTLSDAQKAFQANERRKKEINETIIKLTGDQDQPDTETLNAYKQEKEFIKQSLPNKLQSKREARVNLSLDLFKTKKEILNFYNSFKASVDNQILQNEEFLEGYDIKIEASFKRRNSFANDFLQSINKNKKGSFYGKEDGEERLSKILDDCDFNEESDIRKFLNTIIEHLENDERSTEQGQNRYINEQVTDMERFYEYLFSLQYLEPKYELKLGEKNLRSLSPGERGALLLIFYLIIDKERIPLVIDQPEDNLDNESVYNMLSKFIGKAKGKRQIIMVTHNPNLAVGADAEQIIHVNIDKLQRNTFKFYSGAIEDPKINKGIVKILEGTKPAFDKRKLKYQENTQ